MRILTPEQEGGKQSDQMVKDVGWLQESYGLDPIGAQTLMGMVVDYEVGNVFDPAYTMICKMPKKWLTR